LAAMRRDRIAVLVAATDTGEQGWKDMLRDFASVAGAPFLIVASRHADNRLWAEVLNLGGYDVLSKPFYAAEVTRVISLACERWTSLYGRRSEI
jgi:hypothetical protein